MNGRLGKFMRHFPRVLSAGALIIGGGGAILAGDLEIKDEDAYVGLTYDGLPISSFNELPPHVDEADPSLYGIVNPSSERYVFMPGVGDLYAGGTYVAPDGAEFSVNDLVIINNQITASAGRLGERSVYINSNEGLKVSTLGVSLVRNNYYSVVDLSEARSGELNFELMLGGLEIEADKVDVTRLETQLNYEYVQGETAGASYWKENSATQDAFDYIYSNAYNVSVAYNTTFRVRGQGGDFKLTNGLGISSAGGDIEIILTNDGTRSGTLAGKFVAECGTNTIDELHSLDSSLLFDSILIREARSQIGGDDAGDITIYASEIDLFRRVEGNRITHTVPSNYPDGYHESGYDGSYWEPDNTNGASRTFSEAYEVHYNTRVFTPERITIVARGGSLGSIGEPIKPRSLFLDLVGVTLSRPINGGVENDYLRFGDMLHVDQIIDAQDAPGDLDIVEFRGFVEVGNSNGDALGMITPGVVPGGQLQGFEEIIVDSGSTTLHFEPEAGLVDLNYLFYRPEYNDVLRKDENDKWWIYDALDDFSQIKTITVKQEGRLNYGNFTKLNPDQTLNLGGTLYNGDIESAYLSMKSGLSDRPLEDSRDLVNNGTINIIGDARMIVSNFDGSHGEINILVDNDGGSLEFFNTKNVKLGATAITITRTEHLGSFDIIVAEHDADGISLTQDIILSAETPLINWVGSWNEAATIYSISSRINSEQMLGLANQSTANPQMNEAAVAFMNSGARGSFELAEAIASQTYDGAIQTFTYLDNENMSQGALNTSLSGVARANQALGSQLDSYRAGLLGLGLVSLGASGGLGDSELASAAELQAAFDEYEAGEDVDNDSLLTEAQEHYEAQAAENPGEPAMGYNAEYRWSSFVNGFVGFGEQGSDGTDVGYKYNNVGVSFGVDYSFNSNLKAGFVGGYSYNDAEVYQEFGESHDHTVRFGGFGSYKWQGFYVDAATSLGLHFIESKRNIPTLSVVATGERTSFDLNFLTRTGYTFKDLPLGLRLTPTLELDYTYFRDSDYIETGAESVGANLRYDAFSVHSFNTDLGLRAGKLFDFGAVELLPEVWLGWEHEFAGDGTVISSFEGLSSNTWASEVSSIGKDRLNLGLGATAVVDDRISMFCRYDHKVWDRGFDGRVSFGLKLSF